MFLRILLIVFIFGGMGAIWMTLSGVGATPMGGVTKYQKSVRPGSKGGGRGYYYGGK